MYFFLVSGLMVLGIISAEIILVVRTWAIWGRTRLMGIFLTVIAALCIITVISIEIVTFNSGTFTPIPSNGCLATQQSKLLGIDFIIIIIFESFVLILTLIKGLQHYRSFGLHGCLSVLYRDGILFYLSLLGISVLNLAIAVVAPLYLGNGLVSLQRVIHATLGARVLINLREARNSEVNYPDGLESTVIQIYTFAQTETYSDGIRVVRQPISEDASIADYEAR